MEYWKSGIKNSILKRFIHALSDEERDVSCDIRSKLLLLPLFERLLILCGIQIDEGKKELRRAIKHQIDVLFEIRHIEKLIPKEKSIHHIDFAEGTLLSQKAAQSAGEGADELFDLADKRFAATLTRKPDDYRALHNWGLSLAYRANRFQGDEADRLFDLAAQKFQSSLTINPNDSFALFLWGNMLSSRALKSKKNRKKYLIEAIDKYTRAHKIHPTMELLYNWGNVLLHLANLKPKSSRRILQSACKKYKEAVELKGSNDCKKTYRNWGVALAKYARVLSSQSNAEVFFNEAEEKLKLSLEHKQCESDAEVYFNWGNIHYHRAVFDARNHKFQSSFKQLINAGEKYLAAIENNVYNCNALYNWGKVIILQLHIDTVYHPDKYSIHSSVDLFLAIFLSVIKSTAMSLEPIIAICHVSNLEIAHKALSCLEKLASEMTGNVHKHAAKALKQFHSTSRFHQSQFSSSNPSVVLFLQKLESSIPASLQSISKKSKEKPSLADYEKLSTLNTSKSEFNVHLKGRGELFVMKVKYNELAGESSVPDYLSHFEDGVVFVARVIYHYLHTDGNFYYIQDHVPEDRLLAKLRRSLFFGRNENFQVLNHSSSTMDLQHQSVWMYGVQSNGNHSINNFLFKLQLNSNSINSNNNNSINNIISSINMNNMNNMNNNNNNATNVNDIINNGTNHTNATTPTRSPNNSPNVSPSSSPLSPSLALTSFATPKTIHHYKYTPISQMKKQVSFLEDIKPKFLSFNLEDTLIRRSRSDAAILCNQKEEFLAISNPLHALPEEVAVFYLAEIVVAFEVIHKLGYVYGFVYSVVLCIFSPYTLLSCTHHPNYNYIN